MWSSSGAGNPACGPAFQWVSRLMKGGCGRIGRPTSRFSNPEVAMVPCAAQGRRHNNDRLPHMNFATGTDTTFLPCCSLLNKPLNSPGKRCLIGFLIWLAVALLDSPRQPAAEYSWYSVLVSMIEWGMWAALAPMIVWMDRRLPVRPDDLSRRLMMHALLSFPLAFCTALLHTRIDTALLHPPRGAHLIAFFPSHLMIYWAIAGVSIAWGYYKQFLERQLRATELEKRLAEARLEALRAQLQPHFLFNALNAVSAQVEVDRRRTAHDRPARRSAAALPGAFRCAGDLARSGTRISGTLYRRTEGAF